MTRALIVVDIQESFRETARWQAVSDPDIAAVAGRLVEAARRDGDAVFWILHTEPGTGNAFDPASGHVRLMAGLEPVEAEPVLHKTSRNAFTTTNLQQLLTEAGINELVICGIQTEQCCETTTRVAADLGYQVTFVIDATATFPIPHPSAPRDQPIDQVLADSRTLDTQTVMRNTEYALAHRFATITTVEAHLGALTRS
jgi:nicotinamidase-related amidase